MRYAVRVNEKSLDLIATNNGGLRPEIEEVSTYFVLPEDPNKSAVIMPGSIFFETYAFVGPEHPDKFCLIRALL